jgi:hypothetical protein
MDLLMRRSAKLYIVGEKRQGGTVNNINNPQSFGGNGEIKYRDWQEVSRQPQKRGGNENITNRL